MGANSLEAFTIETVNRKDIHGADYNPRKITEPARKKLKKFLKTNGLWSPLVLNKRTMTLVSGHQRLFIMDALLRKDDYELTMSCVDVDEKLEVSGNVFMNNQSAMGEWDVFALEDLHTVFPDIDFEADFGFDKADIDVMFDFDIKQEEKKFEQEKAREYTVDAFREAKKNIRKKAKTENAAGGAYNLAESDYCVTVVFPNNHEKREFMKKIRKSEKETCVKSSVLMDIYNHVYNISVFDRQE
jgi:hypothetical protein